MCTRPNHVERTGDDGPLDAAPGDRPFERASVLYRKLTPGGARRRPPGGDDGGEGYTAFFVAPGGKLLEDIHGHLLADVGQCDAEGRTAYLTR